MDAKTIDKWVMVGYEKAGYPERDVKVYIQIKWDGKRLSLSGVSGPKANGDAHGGCGQISLDHVVPLDSGVDTAKLSKVWKRWHLNDMQPGSYNQREWLRANPIAPEDYAYPKNHYDVASARLAAAGLNPDQGYKYGAAWLHEDVPQDVIDYLDSLPACEAPRGWGHN